MLTFACAGNIVRKQRGAAPAGPPTVRMSGPARAEAQRTTVVPYPSLAGESPSTDWQPMARAPVSTNTVSRRVMFHPPRRTVVHRAPASKSCGGPFVGWWSIRQCVRTQEPSWGAGAGIIRWSVASVSASLAGLSVRQRAMRGNRTATPDL